MLNLIKKLRSKPENVRRRIVIAIAGTITFIFFVIWILSFSVSLKSVSVPKNSAFSIEPVLSAISSAERQIKGFVEQFGSSLEYTSTSSNPTPIVVE